MKSPIILRIFKNNQLVEVKQFEVDPVIFGHNADVTVDLDDESVSAIHCLIELRDSGYYICDMASATGTKKNGHAVLDEPISSGDNIEVGPYRIQFFVGTPKPKVVPASVASKSVTPPPAPPVAAPKVTPPKATVPEDTVAPVSARPPKLPETRVTTTARSTKVKRGQGTFAPPSEVQDLGSYLKNTKGPVVEVIVAWQERVLATYHFGADQIVTIGSTKKANIAIPVQFMKGVAPFIELKGGCRVLAPIDMALELTTSTQLKPQLDEMIRSGKAIKTGSAHAVRLDQGELLKLSMAQGTLQIFVRYVPNTVKPILAAPFDFSAGELTGLVVSLVIVALTALYMSVYTPNVILEQEEEQVRLAQFIYNKPPPTTVPKAEPTPPPTKEVVEVKPPPPVEPKKASMSEKQKEAVQKGNKNSMNAMKQVEAAKAAEVRPMPSKLDRPKKFTSIKQGGATKIGETAGANAQSNKDVSKVGLLSAFGGGGVRKQLDQAYSGSGELLGMANEATGRSGQNDNRAGDDIGSRFKDTGAGGKGTATQGISGIGTKGRASGMSNYGSGIGLGGKGNVTIEPGGADEAWEGTIDREAVRRVILSIINQIKSCYERQLRVDSSLEGKVVIRFEIMEQGRVRSAKTQSTSLNNSTVESCVATRIREARFPEPPEGTVAQVDYPFVFGAQK